MDRAEDGIFGCGGIGLQGYGGAYPECAPNIDTMRGTVTSGVSGNGIGDDDDDDDDDEDEECVGTHRAVPLQNRRSSGVH